MKYLFVLIALFSLTAQATGTAEHHKCVFTKQGSVIAEARMMLKTESGEIVKAYSEKENADNMCFLFCMLSDYFTSRGCEAAKAVSCDKEGASCPEDMLQILVRDDSEESSK